MKASIAMGVLIVGLMAFNIWWHVYKYKDCRRVGHTKTYCMLDSGK
jgi:hypothetical protein